MSYLDAIARLESQISQLQDARMEEARERDRLRAELAQSREMCTKFEAAVGEDVGTILQLREFAGWVDAWVSNPVGAYSVHALDGLFRMTREKLAALSPSHSETP